VIHPRLSLPVRCGRRLRTALLGLVALLSLAAVSPEARAGSANAGASGAPDVTNPHGEMKTECEVCHTAKSWKKMRKPVIFDHGGTGFALVGRHASTDCVRCHRSLEFARVATSCGDCHRDIHEGKSGARCQDCHSPSGWTNRSQAVAEHSNTGFRLRGMHALIECARCHVGSGETNRVPLSRECYPCHAVNFATAQNPNHTTAGYSTQCEGCHDPGQARWGGAGFNHALTGFVLTGAHTAAACTSCHVGGRYAGTPRDCYSCHQTAFAATTDPNHTTAGIPTTCASCHSTATWSGASFNHSLTRFALTGAHTTTPCASCHVGGVYTGTPNDCYSCHQTNYTATTNPNHSTLSYPTACASCHSTSSWSGASFNHSLTGFALTGAHTSTACVSCHVNGQYTGTPSDCYSCHQTNYAATTNPNHTTAGYPTTCATCHSTAAWSPANIDHDRLYFRIYSGHHVGRWSSCSTCHTNTSSFAEFTCLSCHTHDKLTADSQHQGRSGYLYDSNACYSCHRNS